MAKRVRRQKYSAEPLATIPDEAAMGPAMRALPPKYRIFVYEVAAGITGYGAIVRCARVAGLGTETSSPASLSEIGRWVLHRPDVQEALKEIGGKRLRIAAFKALESLETIAADPTHPQCVQATKVLLDRSLPIETRQHIVVEKIDHTRQALDELKTLRRLGVAREKLEELYGRDGLYHLEQQLDGAMKLIEGTVNGRQ